MLEPILQFLVSNRHVATKRTAWAILSHFNRLHRDLLEIVPVMCQSGDRQSLAILHYSVATYRFSKLNKPHQMLILWQAEGETIVATSPPLFVYADPASTHPVRL
ncbi:MULTISPECIES: hypothetical protein [unclassified Chamaesiphon]|uniref:hypothetical protein n=1 Tax=unclassified Chamaesiphon TaxID=2620921 RepID=UPI00286C08B8|nr:MULTISPECIES: hypothetical protein [unclassified Chamaesiphon]